MNSIFKVGDKVRVRATYHPNCEAYDYPYNFVHTMLKKYGNTKVTITKVERTYSSAYTRCKMYVEPYRYFINNSFEYTWSAAMFDNFKESPTIF